MYVTQVYVSPVTYMTDLMGMSVTCPEVTHMTDKVTHMPDGWACVSPTSHWQPVNVFLGIQLFIIYKLHSSLSWYHYQVLSIRDLLQYLNGIDRHIYMMT